MATMRPSIGIFDDSDEALDFVNARDAEPLAEVGTSCPDHFVRTRIKPLLRRRGTRPRARSTRCARPSPRARHGTGRTTRRTTTSFATPTSPRLRDPNPSVVLVPGVGLFAFGTNRSEARLHGRVLPQRHPRDGRRDARSAAGARRRARCSQPKSPEKAAGFTAVNNYVALPGREAFNIEYWALEEAKLQRMPPPKELSRRVCLIVGGGSGIGRAVALKAAALGAHVVIADVNEAAAAEAARRRAASRGRRRGVACAVDITNRDSIRRMFRDTVRRFGGLDILVNTAAVVPVAGSRRAHHRRAVALDARR